MTVVVETCGVECVTTVEELVSLSMSWFHGYYARSCLEAGICKAVIVKVGEESVGSGLYYKVAIEPQPLGVIYYVVVKDVFRGLGYGKVIVSSIEELLSQDGVRYFIATTRKTNNLSINMFRSLGYLAVELSTLGDLLEVIRYITCGYDDDVLLIKGELVENVEDVKLVIRQLIKSRRNMSIVKNLWERICHEPWVNLRKRTAP